MDSLPGVSDAPRPLAALSFAGLVVLAAHFTRLGQFGLYEDDYWSIAPHLGEPISGLWPAARYYFTHWPTGRPLNHLLPHALAVAGSTVGGLGGVYVLAAAWLTLNGLLVFLAARRLVSAPAALVAAAAYLLYPADTTKELLTPAAHVQGGMTFMLLGSWLWLRGGRARVLAYPIAALSLLAYESTFLPFLALPLLAPPERGRRLPTWVAHAGAVALLVGLDVWARVATGDRRAAAIAGQAGQTLWRAVSSLWLGPATGITSWFSSAVAGLRALDPLATFSALLVALALALLLARTGRVAVDGERVEAGAPAPAGGLAWWQLFLAALLTWAGSYALTVVNYPPTQLVGRLTSTHVAAGWPAALAMGALIDGLHGRGAWRTRLAVGVAALWAGALVGYHHQVQRGFVRAFDEERRFWRQITTLSPDVGPGWSVIVTGSPLNPSPVILSNAWSDHLAHRQIYTRGVDPSGPGFAHLGFVGSQVELVQEGGTWSWRPEFWGGPVLPVDPARLALFQDDRGTVRRVEAVQLPTGLLRSTAPIPSAPRAVWPHTPVARLLFPEAFPAP
jgi:hypothetical protein